MENKWRKFIEDMVYYTEKQRVCREMLLLYKGKQEEVSVKIIKRLKKIV